MRHWRHARPRFRLGRDAWVCWLAGFLVGVLAAVPTAMVLGLTR